MTPHQAGQVSCVMPTRGRAGYVARALGYFRRQTWPERELIVVHEADDDLPPGLETEPDVRLVRATGDRSIGAKRNLGAAAARGAFIAQWDDDDWYGPERLSAQLAPLLAGEADLTALTDVTFFELPAWRFWRCSPALHARMFVEDVAGGTLVYRRELFGPLTRYPQTSLREDADFLSSVLRRGARLARVPGEGLYLYLRHAANTWRFVSGAFLSAEDWLEVAEPPTLAEDRAFYRGLLPPPPPRRGTASAAARPQVACIMPTADRPAFVRRAIRHFLAQSYAPRTLLILDDGEHPVEAEVPEDPRIRYVRTEPVATLGEKRNLACSLTEGELILHWDDDDWMAPGWIEAQVDALESHRADVVGLSDLYFYAAAQRRAWRYAYPGGLRPWVAGATLAYRRAFWAEGPFPPLQLGEDVRFLWSRSGYRLVAHPRRDLFVASVHGGNTERRALSGARWSRCAPEVVERLFVAGERDQAG
jgi:glycosyltransferase involved in cell wall biosynthesis